MIKIAHGVTRLAEGLCVKKQVSAVAVRGIVLGKSLTVYDIEC